MYFILGGNIDGPSWYPKWTECFG